MKDNNKLSKKDIEEACLRREKFLFDFDQKIKKREEYEEEMMKMRKKIKKPFPKLPKQETPKAWPKCKKCEDWGNVLLNGRLVRCSKCNLIKNCKHESAKRRINEVWYCITCGRPEILKQIIKIKGGTII